MFEPLTPAQMADKSHRKVTLSDQVRACVERLDESALREVAQALRTASKAKGLLLQTEKAEEMIPIALNPWVFRPETARYLQGLFRGIRRTVNRVLARYFDDPRLQAILPLREAELKWLQESCSDGMPRLQTVFERFDTNLGSQPENQLDDFKIIEFNGVGVGCIHLMPAATELIQEQLVPRLKEALPDIAWAAPADYRQLLLQELQAHSRAIEREKGRLGLIERREMVVGGCDEFACMARFFQEKGVSAEVGDPREIEQREGSLLLKGNPIDVLYRDFQLEEVVSIKTHGGSVEGIEAAFGSNQIVSTVFGEFDHKSLCELLSNPEFADYFSPQELQVARKRFPWTRLVEERKTADPDGKEIDLIPFLRENRERMVLKPNRGYGGEGVIVGEAVTASSWEEALNRAVSKPKNWVAQEQVRISKAPMVVLTAGGRIESGERYVTLGVTATSRGVSFVGRCSEGPVVNISQGGGLVPVFLSFRRR